MAEGIKALYDRPYVDRDRVGIYGTSYGGYSAVMSILRDSRRPEPYWICYARRGSRPAARMNMEMGNAATVLLCLAAYVVAAAAWPVRRLGPLGRAVALPLIGAIPVALPLLQGHRPQVIEHERVVGVLRQIQL